MRMMSFDEASPAQISKMTAVAIACLALAGFGLGGKAVYSSAVNKAAELRITALNAQLREKQGSMRHVNEVLASGPPIQGPSGKPILIEFQSAVEKAGRSNDVRVEFTQIGDPGLFISRYKNVPDDTLQQMEAQISMSGNLADIVRTLDQFSSFKIPYELGEMQVARDTSLAGAGKVVVRLSAFILVPTEVPK